MSTSSPLYRKNYSCIPVKYAEKLVIVTGIKTKYECRRNKASRHIFYQMHGNKNSIILAVRGSISV
jgi:hypothetical protein